MVRTAARLPTTLAGQWAQGLLANKVYNGFAAMRSCVRNSSRGARRTSRTPPRTRRWSPRSTQSTCRCLPAHRFPSRGGG
jgi:hypothetical protein